MASSEELTPDDVGKLKVTELRAELKARDLPTAGLKKELADRLVASLSGNESPDATTEQEKEQPAQQAEDAVEAGVAAAPETGLDVPSDAQPSGDSTAQTSAEAPTAPSAEATAQVQAGTDHLPSELPAVPPVTTDSVADYEGAEGSTKDETATAGVQKIDEPSEVVKPVVDTMDKTPGFVADSKVDKTRQAENISGGDGGASAPEIQDTVGDALSASLHAVANGLPPPPEPVSALPADEENGSLKRKRDEEEGAEVAVQSIAAQEVEGAPANDSIQPAPGAEAILSGANDDKTSDNAAPEAKRTRVEENVLGAALASDPVINSLPAEDIPVPNSNSGDRVNGNGNLATSAEGMFPTSIITPGLEAPVGLMAGAPDIVPFTAAFPSAFGVEGLQDPPTMQSGQDNYDFDAFPAKNTAVEAVDFTHAASLMDTGGSVMQPSAVGDQEGSSKLTNKSVPDTSPVAADASLDQRACHPSPIHATSFPSPAIPHSIMHPSQPEGSSSHSPSVQNQSSRSLNIKGSSSATVPAQRASRSLFPTQQINRTDQKDASRASTGTLTSENLQDRIASSSSSTISYSNINNQETSSERPPVSRSICISNLARPFALPELKEKLEAFGDFGYFWINVFKSHCFVTYDDISSAKSASASLEGIQWPEVTGKPLSVTYIPSDRIASLVEKEESVGRARHELAVTWDEEASEWKYNIEPFTLNATAGGSRAPLGPAPPVPRGLASSIPLQARSMQAQASGSTNRGSTITATSANGASIQIPSGSGFAQSRPPPTGPAAGGGGRRDATSDERKEPWRPQPGNESVYKRTKTEPELFYRPVDPVAAGRKLRELERGNPPRTNGRSAPYDARFNRPRNDRGYDRDNWRRY